MSKSTTGRRRGLATLATTALVAGACFAGAGAASADAGFKFNRISGEDRYGTAASVQDAYGDTNDVIIANGAPGNYADALSANYLSGVKNAPILLTKADSMPAATQKAIKDSGAHVAWIVGGTDVVSQAQEDGMKAAGLTVHRIAGADRFKTDAQVVAEGGKAKRNVAVVATGFNFPDALAGGPVAYTGSPVALTTKDKMDQGTVDALKAAGVTHAVILGGTDVVAPTVEAQLKAAGITVDYRADGADRAETSVKAATYAVKNFGLTNKGVDAASGYVKGYGADALAGGPLAGKEGRPLLVTKDVNIPGASVLQYLKDNANTLHEGDIFGGPAAISLAAQDQMEKAAQSVTSNQSYTVTPQDAATLTLSTTDSTTDADNSDDRSFTVNGLDDTKTYKIALFKASNVTNDGQVSFADTDKNAQADGYGDSSVAKIVSVNNQGVTFGGTATAVPVNGTVKFTIDGVASGSVVPVVYLDANNDNQVNLNASNQPTEAFGVGGVTTFVPAEATQGADLSTGTVDSVNKTANSFTAHDSSTAETTFKYDSNDYYYVNNQQATMQEFAAALSRGDGINVWDYQPNSALQSSFGLSDTSPAKLAAPSASGTTDNSTVITFTGVDPNASKVTVYGTKGSEGAPTTKSPVLATATTDADAKTDGFQVNVTGLSAGTTYHVAGTQTVDGDESTISNPVDVTTKSAAAKPATITAADLKTDQVQEGTPDTGDVWTAKFSEPVTPTNADGSPSTTNPTTAPDPAKVQNPVISLVDGNGDTIQVTCQLDGKMPTTPVVGMTYATCSFPNTAGADGIPGNADDQPTYAGTDLTITLLNPAQDRNAGGDSKVTYPLTVTGVQNVVDVNDGLPIDLANSTDKTVG